MRRFLAVLALGVLAACVLAGAALAKEGGVELASLPVGVKPGEPWATTLRLVEGTPDMLAAAEPGVTIRNRKTGKELRFPARPTADPREYYVRVVFPGGGLWTVEAYDGVSGRSYVAGGGHFFVDGPARLPVTRRASPLVAGFPLWPTAGGSLGFVLAAGGAALFLRRRDSRSR
jgi:hypothetical protein